MAQKKVKIGNVDIKIERQLSELDLWQQAVRYGATQEVLDLESLQLNDINNRIRNREKLKDFLIKLLIGQNIAVFGLVLLALLTDQMNSLQLVFSVLIGATLAETSSMVFFMVKWLFSDIEYKKIN